MLCVGRLDVLAHPDLYICNLGEFIPRSTLARIQRRVAQSKANIIYVCLRDDLIAESCRDSGWVLKEVKKTVCREPPTLLIPLRESLRATKSLCEGYDTDLAVYRAGKLSSGTQNDLEIDWSEDVCLQLFRMLNEVVRTQAGF